MTEAKAFEVGQRVRVVSGVWLEGETGVIVALENNIYGVHVRLDQAPTDFRGLASFTGDELVVIVPPESDPQAAEIAALRAEVALEPFAELWDEWRGLAANGETDDSFVIWLAWVQETAAVMAFKAAHKALHVAEAASDD